jgi:hypothetical protein
VLLTVSANEQVRGDMRVLERLVEKEGKAHQALGDVQALLNLYNAAAEEQHLIDGIEQGRAPEDIIPDPEQAEPDFLDLLLGEQTLDQAEHALVATHERPSLFADDLAFVLEGWRELADNYPDIQPPTEHPDAQGLEIEAPEDLQLRFEQLPPELIRESSSRFKLSSDRALLMREFQRARERKQGWPAWHLLWEQHPIHEWLSDRLVAHMTRHAAPVIRVAKGLAAGQRCFVFQGVLSNQRSQPILCAWFGVVFDGNKPDETLAWNALVARTGLDQPVPNDGHGHPEQLDQLAPLRDAAVAAGYAHMSSLRSERAKELAPKLRTEIRRLRDWAAARLDAIEAQLAHETRPARQAAIASEQANVEQTVARRTAWFHETMTTEDQPYLRLAAVLISG